MNMAVRTLPLTAHFLNQAIEWQAGWLDLKGTMDKGVRLQLQGTCTLRHKGGGNRRRSVVHAQRGVRSFSSLRGRKSLDPPRAFLELLKVSRYWSTSRPGSRGLHCCHPSFTLCTESNSSQCSAANKTEVVYQQPLGYAGVTKTALVYLSFWRGAIGLIDHRWLKLGLEGGASDDRKEECSWGPYLEAPGCRDEKRNVGTRKRKWAQM